MGKIIMCGSFKGGVGKSVTTFNLAYSLAEIGKKVLAVDFDSQANLTTCFGVEDVEALPVTIGHLMMAEIEEEELPETVDYIHSRNGVDYIPSSMVLSAVDSKLRLEMGAEGMLSRILEPLRDQYDFEYGEDKVVNGVKVNDKCKALAKKIKEIIDTKSSFADWLNNQIVRDQLKFDIKVCLIKNGYPPQYSPEVFRKVMEQVENFEENN